MDARDFRRQVAATFYRTYCPDRTGEIDYIDFNYPVRDVAHRAGHSAVGI